MLPASFFRLAAVLLVMLLTTAAWARQVRLTLEDGRVITGTFVSEDQNSVTISISQINTTFQRRDIRRMDEIKSVAEQYAERRAQIADDDLDARYALIIWVYEQRDYDLARRELEAYAQDAPQDNRVNTLRQAIEQQMRAADRTTTQPRIEPEQPVAPEGEEAAVEVKDGELLTKEQMNLIKVYEVNLEERPPVHIPPEIIERFFKEYSDQERAPRGPQQQAEFRRAQGWQQLSLLFELRARPLYQFVEVRRDPAPLAQFRREVHTNYVVNYCGAANCHGSPNASDFFVFRDTRNREDIAYTNFFILNRYENSKGRMINRSEPTRSLLLQYGMNPQSAKIRHPEVPGWRPQFHSEDHPRFRAMAAWIGSLYASPPPNYGIEYVPPTPGARIDEEAAEEAEPAPPATP